MAIILVIAVMTGFQDEIRERLLGIRPHIVLVPDWGVRDPKQVVERIKRIDGVASASPFIEFQAMAQGPARVAGVVVRGLQPKDAAFLGRLMKEGSVDALKTGGTILLGRELARDLGLLPGDLFTLVVPFGGFSPAGAAPETVRVRVGGTFETGMFDIDSLVAIMPLADVESTLGAGVTGIEVKVKDVYAAGEVRDRIVRGARSRLFRKDMDGAEQEPAVGAQAGEAGHVHHSCPHHPRGELQHHQRAGDDRHGEKEGYRHSQGHGRHEQEHHARLCRGRPDDRRLRRASRHARRLRACWRSRHTSRSSSFRAMSTT